MVCCRCGPRGGKQPPCGASWTCLSIGPHGGLLVSYSLGVGGLMGADPPPGCLLRLRLEQCDLPRCIDTHDQRAPITARQRVHAPTELGDPAAFRTRMT